MKKAELRMNTGNTGTQNSHAALGRESKSALVVVAEPQPTEDPSCHEALDPEVCDRATRRRFTAEYKRSILAQADGVGMKAQSARCCAGKGSIPRI